MGQTNMAGAYAWDIEVAGRTHWIKGGKIELDWWLGYGVKLKWEKEQIKDFRKEGVQICITS